MSGYGNLWVANVAADSLYNDETYVGKPEKDTENTENKHETYILNRQNKSIMNKIIKTKVGDEIHYFVNGQENHGVVAKMSASFVTIFKEDGKFYEVPLNDTFFVKDILVNKSWNDMSMEERTEQLQKAKAYSPRFLGKTWEQLPKELQSVLKQGAPKDIPKPKGDGQVLPIKEPEQTRQGSAREGREFGMQSSSSQQPTGVKPSISQSVAGIRNPKIQPPVEEQLKEMKTKLPKGGESPLAKALEQLEQLTKDKGVVEAKTRTQHSGAPQIARRVVTGLADDKERRRGVTGHVSGKWTRGFADDKFQTEKDKRNVKEGMEALGKLKKALESIKSDVEQGVYGNVAGRPTNGLSTDTKVDAPKDYEGHSHEGIRTEQFKYEDKKPKVDDDHKTKAGEFVYTDNPEQYKTKSIGVPEVQQNTWGIKYVTKEEREKLQSKD